MDEEQMHILFVTSDYDKQQDFVHILESENGLFITIISVQIQSFKAINLTVVKPFDVLLIDTEHIASRVIIQLINAASKKCRDSECILLIGKACPDGLPPIFNLLHKTLTSSELAKKIFRAAQDARIRLIERELFMGQSPSQVFNSFVTLAPDLKVADDLVIAIYDPVTRKGNYYSRPGFNLSLLNKLDQNPGRLVQKTNQVVLVDSPKDELLTEELTKAGFQSYISIPIPTQKSNAGVLFAFSHNVNCFKSWETNAIIKTLARRVGMAAESAKSIHHKLYEEDKLSSLIETGHQLTLCTNLDQQVNIVWDFISSQLNVSSFLFGLYDLATDTVHFPLVVDENTRIQMLPRKLGENIQSWGLSGYVVKTGEELHWNTRNEGSKICRKLPVLPIRLGKVSESCFYLPVKSGKIIKGVISIQSYNPYAFDETLLNLFRAFSSQLSLSLETQRILQTTETLREAGLALARDTDAKQIFQTLLIELKRVVPYDWATVQIFELGCFKIIDGFGFDNPCEVLGETFLIDGSNPNSIVYNKRSPLILADAPKVYPQFIKRPHPRNSAPTRGWLGVPMIVGDEVIGMIALDKQEPDFYNEEHARLAEVFAAQAAINIRNAKLLENARQWSAYIKSIYEANSQIVSFVKSKDVLNSAAENLQHLTHAWRVVIIEVNKNEIPCILAQSGFEGSYQEAIRIRHNGITRHVMETKTSCFLPKIYPDSLDVNPFMIEQGIRSAACLPLLVDDNPIGVLWIHFLEEHYFSEIEQLVLKLFANQVATAYDRNRLNEEFVKVRDQAQVAGQTATQGTTLQKTLESFVQAAIKAINCDIATLYTYQEEQDEFGFPPALEGVKDSKSVLALGCVSKNSLVRKIIEMDVPYACVNTEIDPLTKKAYERNTQVAPFVVRESVKSFYAVPLKVWTRKVGVLFISYRRAHSFNINERNNIALFSNQAAIAIRNAQLYEEASSLFRQNQYQARFLDALIESSKAISSSLSLEEILQQIAKQACLLTGHHGKPAQFSHLSLIQEDHLVFKTAFPPDEVAKLKHVIRDINITSTGENIGITGKAVRERKSQLVEDVEKLRSDYIEYDPLTRSELAVPILLGNKVIGVINVEHYETSNFDYEDQHILEMLALQAAIAIQMARHYESERQGQNYIQSLYEASCTNISAVEPQAVLDSIVKTIVKPSKAWRSAVLLIDNKDNQPCVLAHWGFNNSAEAAIPIRLRGISKRVIKTDKPFFRANIQPGDPDVNPSLVAQGVKAVACLPLKLTNEENRILGVLWIHYREPHTFSEIEIQALKLYALQSAITYERALRYKELKQTKGMAKNSTAVAWMGMISNTWRHSVELDALTIKDQSELIKIKLKKPNPDPSKIEDQLNTIYRLADRIIKKPMTPPLSAEENVGPILINDMVKERIHQLCKNEPYSYLQITMDLLLENDISVYASNEWLRRALDALVDNAVKAIENQVDGKIKITTQRNGNQAEIIIQDSGPRIPESIRKRIFTEPVQKGEGLGLGLLMAQMIVQTYGGDVWLDSNSSEWTTFVIGLPVGKGR